MDGNMLQKKLKPSKSNSSNNMKASAFNCSVSYKDQSLNRNKQKRMVSSSLELTISLVVNLYHRYNWIFG